MKRIIAVLLCAACFLCVFVSCQNVAETKTLPQSSQAETSSVPSSSSSVAPSTTAPASSSVPPTSTLSEFKKAEIVINKVRGYDYYINITADVAKAVHTYSAILAEDEDFNGDMTLHFFFEKLQEIIEYKEINDPDYEFNCDKFSEYITFYNGAFIVGDTLWGFRDYGKTKEFTVPANVKRFMDCCTCAYGCHCGMTDLLHVECNRALEKLIFEEGSEIEYIQNPDFSCYPALKTIVIPKDAKVDLGGVPERITVERV